jgi:hypothetical protein
MFTIQFHKKGERLMDMGWIWDPPGHKLEGVWFERRSAKDYAGAKWLQ